MLALQFRDADILATDLSENNLNRHAQLAQSLGLENIEFRQEDLLKSSYREEFDFVSCVGVLHHLPNPAEGFAAISRSMKPSGLAEIMVYDQMNRRYSMRMREILRTFDPNSELGAEERFLLAIEILQSLNKHASAPRELKRILEYLEADPNFRSEMADVVSHPQEHYFDVPSLLQNLHAVDLRVHTWRPSFKFDPKFMLTNPELCAQVDKMSAERSAHLAHLLSAGLLEVFVERNGSAGKPVQPQISERLVRAIPNSLLHQLDEAGKKLQTTSQSKLFRNEGRLWFDAGERRPAVAAYGVDLDCIRPGRRHLLRISDLGFATPLGDEHIEAILKLAATPIRISEIASVVSNNRSLAPALACDIEQLCDRLCRTPFRVLATIDS